MKISTLKEVPWPVYIRIGLGVLGLAAGFYMLIASNDLIEDMKLAVSTTPLFLYAEFVKNIFIPNAPWTVYLLGLISVIGGLLLILGLFITFGVFLMMLISLNFIACELFQPDVIFDILLMILLFVVLFSKQSRRYSVEAKIAQSSWG